MPPFFVGLGCDCLRDGVPVDSLDAVARPFEREQPCARDLGERTKLTQTMRFETAEQRDTTMQYGVEAGAKAGFARIDEVLQRLVATG